MADDKPKGIFDRPIPTSFDLTVHHYIHNVPDPAIASKLDQIIASLATITQKENQLMAAIDDLAADVAAEDTVIGSAVVLIEGFAAQLAAAGVDPTKLAALRADIAAQTQSLANAVAANTTAAPAA